MNKNNHLSTSNMFVENIPLSQLFEFDYYPFTLTEQLDNEVFSPTETRGNIHCWEDGLSKYIISGFNEVNHLLDNGITKSKVFIHRVELNEAVKLCYQLCESKLNPVEVGDYFNQLTSSLNINDSALANILNINRSTVCNYTLLPKLSQKSQGYIKLGRVNFSAIKIIRGQPASTWDELIEACHLRRMSNVALESHLISLGLKSRKSNAKASKLSKAQKMATVTEQEIRSSDKVSQKMEIELSDKIGSPVKIYYEEGMKKGKITIDFASLEIQAGIFKNIMGFKESWEW